MPRGGVRRAREGFSHLPCPVTLVGMAHPKMYDDGDLHFQRVRTLALALPEARMKVSHGRPAFHTQKVFAYYGTSVKGHLGGDGPRDARLTAADGTPLPPGGIQSEDWQGYLQFPRALVIKADGSDADVLTQDPRAFRPAYLGTAGWFALDLSGLGTGEDADADGWAEVAEWLEASYRLTAPARLRRVLDGLGR